MKKLICILGALIAFTSCNSYTKSLCEEFESVNLEAYLGTYNISMDVFGEVSNEGTVEFVKGLNSGEYTIVSEDGDNIFENAKACKINNQIVLESKSAEEDELEFYIAMLVDITPSNELVMNLSELDYELLEQDKIPTVSLVSRSASTMGLGDVLIAVDNKNMAKADLFKYLIKPALVQIKK
jgi:hypothetical protein